TVREIGERLGGHPFAIELAARRASSLAPEALLDRLRMGIVDLGPQLRGARRRRASVSEGIEASAEAISPAARALVEVLDPWIGPVPRELLAVVAGEDAEEAAAELVDHGLAERAEGGYRVTPLVRAVLRRSMSDASRLGARGRRDAALQQI